MSNVKLFIRVRPFTERETKSEDNRVPVIKVEDERTLTITNIKVNGSGAGDSRERVRRYHVDRTFDSSRGPADPCYASQETVFDTVGTEVISCFIRDRSACVLTYGQSATGKTYTMMGTAAQPGLLPRLCEALAAECPSNLTVRNRQILLETDCNKENVPEVDLCPKKRKLAAEEQDENVPNLGKNKKFDPSTSSNFLEIYNERVHDLLAAGDGPLTSCDSLPRRRGNARKDLRVREHPTKGPYVQNLRRVSVSDRASLLAVVGEGACRRHTAATRRNPHSSRSHALLELATPRAKLHLADLAGSEKASWENGAGGRRRQKEGANINKSLVALSNVISALVSGRNSRSKYVPYRDSALTWLLKDCFTGGGSAFIIATVSPSSACYSESASTLRWAARARQLPAPKLGAAAPADQPRGTLLRAQLNQLLQELSKHHILYTPETGKISLDDNHWNLHLNSIHSQVAPATSIRQAKIGNITMSSPQLKGNVPNSESIASSVASGSSDNLDMVLKNCNITDDINKEVDKIFGPALTRANSGNDLKVVTPHISERKYKSQELLTLDEVTKEHLILPQKLQNKIDTQDKTLPVTILHDNQRAEIVASVTERLYSKLKKNEEGRISKIDSMGDRRVSESLNELKICTNARQRLMELSRKAMRNKRRIGIPAYTQTKPLITRVRDQYIDVQTDLDSYTIRTGGVVSLKRDVSTETTLMTPRCKEISVGPKYGSVFFFHKSTMTDKKQKKCKNSFTMTDDVPAIYSRHTQTQISTRKPKRRSSSQCTNKKHDSNFLETNHFIPIVNINISQPYLVETDSDGSANELESNNITHNVDDKILNSTLITPDLLTNHDTLETNIKEKDNVVLKSEIEDLKLIDNAFLTTSSDEFLNPDDHGLSKITVKSLQNPVHEDMRETILGRSKDVYPYNISLSPNKEKVSTKRVVKFRDFDDGDSSIESDLINDEAIKSGYSTDTFSAESCSDSTDSSKITTDSFTWKKTYDEIEDKSFTYAHNSNDMSRNNLIRGETFKELLRGCNKSNEIYSKVKNHSSKDSCSLNENCYKLRQQKKNYDSFRNNEDKILRSCDSLEKSVNVYDKYLRNNEFYAKTMPEDPMSSMTKPKKYLQHLLKLRREVVKATDSIDRRSSQRN